MSLPDRAYGERQQVSPIKIQGVVKDVTSEQRQCCVVIQVESIDRNRSEKILKKGDLITVLVISERPSSDGFQPTSFQAPPIGRADCSADIPSVSSHTQAWLRPAVAGTSDAEAPVYELMAGPFGFGPNLEDQLPQ
jgi:hypothetical protein